MGLWIVPYVCIHWAHSGPLVFVWYTRMLYLSWLSWKVKCYPRSTGWAECYGRTRKLVTFLLPVSAFPSSESRRMLRAASGKADLG